MNKTLATVSAAAFLACIVAANYITTEYGMVPVGFGLVATAGTYFAGLTFVLRDTVQDAARELLPKRVQWREETVLRNIYPPGVLPGGGPQRREVVRRRVELEPSRWLVAAATSPIVLAGALLSYLVSDPFIALASGVAFLASELADLLIYTPLRRRGYIRAAIASNVVGAVVDTFLFLWIAGFPIAGAWQGQVVGKCMVTLVVVLAVIGVRGVVSRQSVRA